MPDLTRGYHGGGKGNCTVLDAILKQAPLNVNLPPAWLPEKLFTLNFMPYAKSHWAYDGSACNCEDLSSALCAVWDYIKSVKRAGTETPLPRAEKVSCLPSGGMITKPNRVFAGPARGHVRLQGTGTTDGRCLFPVHWICRIGLKYYDPGFSDSWHEMNGAGWISAQDWKTKTARTMHTRSGDLQQVDSKLKSFEDDGASALEALKTAFKNWVARNPKEASSRNVDNCVKGLATFLGV